MKYREVWSFSLLLSRSTPGEWKLVTAHGITCFVWAKHTSVGRKFAPVEGLSHDLVCTGSIYHVHFAWQVWHGQLSPRFKFNKLKSFSGVEIDQNHVDKRILGGKGFAVGRLKRHNFCPASVWPSKTACSVHSVLSLASPLLHHSQSHATHPSR